MSQYKFPQLDGSALVFDDFLKVRRDSLTMPNLARYDHMVLVTRDTSVAVCAQTPEGLWILTEEYRHPTGRYILGLPGGYLESGEDPLEGGLRELLEETGYEAGEAGLVGSAYPYAGVTGQKTFYVWARDARLKSVPMPEPTELLNTVLLSTEEVCHRIKEGHPIDANLCTALFLTGLERMP